MHRAAASTFGALGVCLEWPATPRADETPVQWQGVRLAPILAPLSAALGCQIREQQVGACACIVEVVSMAPSPLVENALPVLVHKLLSLARAKQTLVPANVFGVVRAISAIAPDAFAPLAARAVQDAYGLGRERRGMTGTDDWHAKKSAVELIGAVAARHGELIALAGGADDGADENDPHATPDTKPRGSTPSSAVSAGAGAEHAPAAGASVTRRQLHKLMWKLRTDPAKPVRDAVCETLAVLKAHCPLPEGSTTPARGTPASAEGARARPTPASLRRAKLEAAAAAMEASPAPPGVMVFSPGNAPPAPQNTPMAGVAPELAPELDLGDLAAELSARVPTAELSNFLEIRAMLGESNRLAEDSPRGASAQPKKQGSATKTEPAAALAAAQPAPPQPSKMSAAAAPPAPAGEATPWAHEVAEATPWFHEAESASVARAAPASAEDKLELAHSALHASSAIATATQPTLPLDLAVASALAGHGGAAEAGGDSTLAGALAHGFFKPEKTLERTPASARAGTPASSVPSSMRAAGPTPTPLLPTPRALIRTVEGSEEATPPTLNPPSYSTHSPDYAAAPAAAPEPKARAQPAAAPTKPAGSTARAARSSLPSLALALALLVAGAVLHAPPAAPRAREVPTAWAAATSLVPGPLLAAVLNGVMPPALARHLSAAAAAEQPAGGTVEGLIDALERSKPDRHAADEDESAAPSADESAPPVPDGAVDAHVAAELEPKAAAAPAPADAAASASDPEPAAPPTESPQQPLAAELSAVEMTSAMKAFLDGVAANLARAPPPPQPQPTAEAEAAAEPLAELAGGPYGMPDDAAADVSGGVAICEKSAEGACTVTAWTEAEATLAPPATTSAAEAANGFGATAIVLAALGGLAIVARLLHAAPGLPAGRAPSAEQGAPTLGSFLEFDDGLQSPVRAPRAPSPCHGIARRPC